MNIPQANQARKVAKAGRDASKLVGWKQKSYRLTTTQLEKRIKNAIRDNRRNVDFDLSHIHNDVTRIIIKQLQAKHYKCRTGSTGVLVVSW